MRVAVSPEVTGIALGMNTVMRTIGGVVGGQVGAAILSAVTIGPSGLPAESAFTATFLISGIAAFLAVLCTWRIPRRAREPVPVRGEPGRLETAPAAD